MSESVAVSTVVGLGLRARTLLPLLWFCGLLIGAAAPVQAAQIGTVYLAKGVVTAQLKGRPARFVAKNSPLYESDVLSTSGRSYAVIRLNDDTRMTLRPNSLLALEKFSSVGKKKEVKKRKKESMFMRLFKGGVRVLTGLIGKRNPRGFKLNTPVATIGIRGTLFDVRLCDEEECKDEDLQGMKVHKKGLYAYVRDGAIELTSQCGALPTDKEQTAHMSDADDCGRILSDVPGFILDDPFPSPEICPAS